LPEVRQPPVLLFQPQAPEWEPQVSEAQPQVLQMLLFQPQAPEREPQVSEAEAPPQATQATQVPPVLQPDASAPL
jgi:hypothetical protein